jgi:hypothetical protein
MERNKNSIRVLSILIFVTFSFSLSSQKPTIDELRNMSHQERVNTLNQSLRREIQSNQDASKGNTFAQTYSYNPDELNFDRFKNSPCFDEIGFSPNWDTESLESRYSECENDKLKDKSSKILFVALFVIVVVLIAYFSIVQAKKSTKK